MNILKNMEAVFLVTLAIAGPASVVIDTLPKAYAARTAAIAAPTQQAIPVVVVKGRRMTDAEKRQSLNEETRAASFNLAARGSM